MWKIYLEKANLYQMLAEYYRLSDLERFERYDRKYKEYVKKYAEAYEIQSPSQATMSSPAPFPHYMEWFAKVRVLHASTDFQDTMVDLYANGRKLVSDLPFGVVTPYFYLPPGEYRFEVFQTGTRVPRTTPLLIQRFRVDAKKSYLLAAIDKGVSRNTLQILPYQENPTQMMGKARVRFIHLANGAPMIDVSLPDGTVLFPEVSYKESMDYLALDPTKTDLNVYVAKTKNLITTLPNVGLKVQQVYTIIVLYPNKKLIALTIRDR